MQPYELIVIGSGPGGQRAAIQAVKAGKRVALVEKQAAVGGVCTNTGTIPSKTMREAVLHLSGFYEQSFYGANYHAKDQVTMADLSFRVQRVIESEVSVIQDQLKRNGVDLIHGLGTFTGPHQVRVANGNGFSELEANTSSWRPAPSPRSIPKFPSTAATSSIAIRFCLCPYCRAR
jgi:NAD(P) transhydrogenase